MITATSQPQPRETRRPHPARSVRLVLIALGICAMVPALAALEAWKIDQVWEAGIGRGLVP